MKKEQALKKIEQAWAAFQDSYVGLTDEQMMEPGITGDWSVRDILAHVTWWEAEALKHLPSSCRAAGRRAMPTCTAASMPSMRK